MQYQVIDEPHFMQESGCQRNDGSFTIPFIDRLQAGCISYGYIINFKAILLQVGSSFFF